MKKIVYKIRQNTKALMLGLSLFGVVGLACTFKKQACTTPAMAFIGLVATFKKNKSWEAMDQSSKDISEAMDVVLKDLATNAIDNDTLATKLTEFETKHKNALLSDDDRATFTETVESVKKFALEIQQLKDAGFEAHEVLPFGQAFIKAMREKHSEIMAVKGNEKAFVNLSFKAAAIMGTGNIGNTSAPTLPGTTVISGLTSTPRNQPYILDFVDNGNINTPTIVWYNKINRENGSAMIAEGALKPLSDFDISMETTSVKKVATRFQVNDEMLSDVDWMENEIRTEGVDNLKLVIEDQVLNGDGLGNNLKGILEYAGGYSMPELNDSTEKANEYDAILAAHTQLETLQYMPNAIFVHPVTRYKLRTIKDDNGNYIIPPSSDKNAVNIDGLPVLSKNQVEAGKFLMGDMKKSHVRFLMDINVRVGYSTGDFENNRLSFITEARLLHFIKDLETSAFIYDDFDVVKAALEATAEA